jgi:hypothetical protein
MLLRTLLKADWSMESLGISEASMALVAVGAIGSWVVVVETDIIRRDSSVSNMTLLL